jgi:hypothetical protein
LKAQSTTYRGAGVCGQVDEPAAGGLLEAGNLGAARAVAGEQLVQEGLRLA